MCEELMIAKDIRRLYDSGLYDPTSEESMMAAIKYLELSASEKGGCRGYYADESYYEREDEDEEVVL